MKFYTWDNAIDPDGTFWRESGKYSDYFLNIIRIFYEVGPPTHGEIGEFLNTIIYHSDFVKKLFGIISTLFL